MWLPRGRQYNAAFQIIQNMEDIRLNFSDHLAGNPLMDVINALPKDNLSVTIRVIGV